ncbi:DUF448 domain-containing protein [Helicobacter ailurogastricus]|uniref:Nucleic acid binding transriptional terminator n=1 Tax=Helicobacter ailurogastricus TaxID=1578720 RepID=A0A0K2X4J0_9HELI|nr:DUF448 domain-containing protein [Helicobacter ailurogastricus]CRF40353.1 nucleic acid binding transriptional terminator [Helicobacter ailurogastricus]CRF42420.1 nucleic acid binding transriptional terminator [Helicobacter ailurogastricus]CRF44639.1 nucleic acid binding transriptional terminator [Helicobacter ailurogastricus]GLH58121.1 YlxR family protein [Helicobacter ailurogastricus]GLH59561.1 YlxR family protein [Helicobacter ailurogastricus]
MRISAFCSKNAMRTCVCCRKCFSQATLLRFSVQEGHIVRFSGVGRSFYVCRACLDDKNLLKQVLKTKNTPKDRQYLQSWLEEIRTK